MNNKEKVDDLSTMIREFRALPLIERILIWVGIIVFLPLVVIGLIVYGIYVSYSSTISPKWVGINLILYFNFVLYMKPSWILGSILFLVVLPLLQLMACAEASDTKSGKMPALFLTFIIIIEYILLMFFLPVPYLYFHLIVCLLLVAPLAQMAYDLDKKKIKHLYRSTE